MKSVAKLEYRVCSIHIPKESRRATRWPSEGRKCCADLRRQDWNDISNIANISISLFIFNCVPVSYFSILSWIVQPSNSALLHLNNLR